MASTSLAGNLNPSTPTISDINTFYQIINNLIIVYDFAVINNCIYNCLTTMIGEDWFEPEYGSNLPLRLFEPINDTTSWLIQHDVEDALARWVPIISVDKSNSSVIPLPDLRCYNILVAYSIPAINVSNYYNFQVGPYS